MDKRPKSQFCWFPEPGSLNLSEFPFPHVKMKLIIAAIKAVVRTEQHIWIEGLYITHKVLR